MGKAPRFNACGSSFGRLAIEFLCFQFFRPKKRCPPSLTTLYHFDPRFTRLWRAKIGNMAPGESRSEKRDKGTRVGFEGY